MFNDEAMVEITSKLAGIILKKAELEGNFHGVYSMVFERMYSIDIDAGDELLTVLGEIGG